MPGVVKGSRQQRMVVVPYEPGRKWLRLGLITLLVLGSGVGGYGLGHFLGAGNLRIADTESARLRQQHEQAMMELDQLRAQVSMLDRTTLADQRVNEQAQLTITELRRRVANLERDNALYRQVFSLDPAERGLLISDWEVSPGASSLHYRYRLVFIQQGSRETPLSGVVTLEVEGSLDGEPAVLPHEVLGADADDHPQIPLSLRYLQTVEGELYLPEGFEPERIRVRAALSEPSALDVEQSFEWNESGGR